MADNKDRPLVYITQKIPMEGQAFREILQTCDVRYHEGPQVITRAELLKAVPGVDGLLIQSEDVIDSELLDTAGPSLKVICTLSVGVDHIDLAECTRRNIKVGNTPGVSTNSVAEATIGLMIATARKFKKGSIGLSKGTAWDALTEHPFDLSGPEMKGSTVGIVGLGRIGLAVAKLLASFGISRLLYCGNNPKQYAAEVDAEFVSFSYLLEHSDFVICCCSLNPHNVGMFYSGTFQKMKKTAVFINVSRGAIVDQTALYEALEKGTIFAAGLDVTTPDPLPNDHPLLSLENCYVLPHMVSNSINAINKMAELAADNLRFGLRDQPLLTPVK